jgi:hypothetical protein
MTDAEEEIMDEIIGEKESPISNEPITDFHPPTNEWADCEALFPGLNLTYWDMTLYYYLGRDSILESMKMMRRKIKEGGKKHCLYGLFRLVGRENELDRKILAFSIWHDHKSVRIYGHYPVIEGEKTTLTTATRSIALTSRRRVIN